jgi:hypothetical protein
MYTFIFNHDYKFWTFLTINDIQNQINNIHSKDSLHVHFKI